MDSQKAIKRVASVIPPIIGAQEASLAPGFTRFLPSTSLVRQSDITEIRFRKLRIQQAKEGGQRSN